MNSAILALEDGTVFEGRGFGAPVERSGEVVFNTALTGYQEIFTDPSYSGQIVILTNPQIGNYGLGGGGGPRRLPGGPYATRHAAGSDPLNPLDEAPFASTNSTAENSLTAI